MATFKSRNGESGNGMRGMMRMQGIKVGMWGIRGVNKGNHGENLRIGVEMMNKKCGEGQK